MLHRDEAHTPTAVVLRPLGLGDLLTGVPAIRGIRAAVPGHRLVLATTAALAPLAELVDAVDEVLPAVELQPLDWSGPPPELAVDLWNTLAEKGDLVGGRELWKDLWAISSFLESVNYVAGIKAGLELIGHPAGPARFPIQPLPEQERERFAAILAKAGVISPVAA